MSFMYLKREQMSNNQVNFNLDEESEIEFKLSVKGSTNLPNVKPVMRFVISEMSENGMAVVLPAHPTESGAKVSIPSLKQIFSENKEYVGKLEIIIGNRYFAPTSMNIGFTKSFDVQAEAVIHESNAPYRVESIKTSGEVKSGNKAEVKKDKDVEFKVQTKRKTVVQPPGPINESVEDEEDHSSYNDISDDLLAALEAELKPELKKRSIVVEQPEVVKKPVTPPKKEPAYKTEFKNLLRDALKS